MLPIAAVSVSSSNMKSYIDWRKGEITAMAKYSIRYDDKGLAIDYSSKNSLSINEARMYAYRKAEKTARELIAHKISSIRIDADNTYADIIKSSAYTRQLLGRILSENIKTHQTPDGFYGAKSKAVLKLSEIISTLPYNYPKESFPDYGKNTIPTDYSSVIIDTRGLEIQPMIFPSIYNEQGLEIFGRRHIDIKYARKTGVVSYCRNETEAQNNPKSGEYPYYTVALNTLNNSPVLSDKDVNKILASPKTRQALIECRIIFLIDGDKE